MSDIREAARNRIVWRDHVMALAAALFAMCVYLRTLAPSITGEDSGEFIVAAYTLGVVHPPGYPLFCMLGHMFTWLPFGSIAWRVNLMSSAFGAATVYLLVLIVVLETRNRWAGLGAALVFAVTDEFWQQAVIAEVYTLNTFFLALSLMLLLCWDHSRNRRTLFLFAVVCGLGLAVHNTFLLLNPIYAIYVLSSDWQKLPEKGFWRLPWLRYGLLSLMALVVAMGCYLYLPLASWRNPPLDWGNPETLTNWWRHVRRGQYDFMVTQYPRSLDRLAGQARTMFTLYLGQGFLFLDVVGWLLLARKRFRHAVLFLCVGAVVVAGFAVWQNFEPSRDWIWVISVFAIPAYLMAAIALGMFFTFLASARKSWHALLPGLVMTVVLLLHNGPVNDKSAYAWVRDYGLNILNSLPPNAIYIADSDHGSFSILYLQAVEGMRPDVTNGKIYGYLTLPEFANLPKDLREKAGPFPRRSMEKELLAWLITNTSRPVFMETPPSFSPETDITLASYGLLWRALRPGERAPETNPWPRYQWPPLHDTQGDFTADIIACDLLFAHARDLFLSRDKANEAEIKAALEKRALQSLDAGLRCYGPTDPIMLNNAGAFCAQYGVHDAAASYFEKSLKAYPELPASRRNLDRLERRIGGSTNNAPGA